jgi:hypothetical protein
VRGDVLAIQIGDTYYWGEGGHLWVVISDPSKHCGEFVAVNLTKDEFRAGKDCELHVGDHKWISHKTYVNFGDAMKLGPKEESNLQKQMALKTIKTHSPMSQEVLTKIVAKGKTSKALADELKAYL